MKGKKKIGAMLILAAFLMGAGCKPQQSPEPGVKPTPAPKAPDTKPESKPAVVQETVHFEGIIEKDVQGDSKKKSYMVTVSLSHNKVGATAETIDGGFLYIGKGDYDAENGTMDITLSDAHNDPEIEPITLTATYEKASKVLVISEFDGMTTKAILTRVNKPGEGKISRYNTMVDLGDPIGESFLSLIMKEKHVTAILVSGQFTEDGKTGRSRTYNAIGYVRRGTLFVEIPLNDDENNPAKKRVVEVSGRVSGGVISGVSASLIGKSLPTHEEHLNNNAQYSTLPLFSPARFTINSKKYVKDDEPDENGSHINQKAYLELRVEPLVRALKMHELQNKGNNKNGYVTYGYRMYAQFIGFDRTKSKKVFADAYISHPDTGVSYNYNAATDAYTFEFKDDAEPAKPNSKGEFGNDAGFENNEGKYAFTISDWRPGTLNNRTSGNVITGDYTIDIPETSVGKIPGNLNTAPEPDKFKDLFGSESSIVSGDEHNGAQYRKLDGSTVTSKLAKNLFAKEENFKRVYANTPSVK